MAEFGSKEYNETLKEFKKGRQWLQDVSVEIVGGENELDALTLLRAYESEPTLDTGVSLTCGFVINKEVRFLKKGNVVFSFTYRGGDISDCFSKAPYLFDTLIKACWGLLIKKLTPPSQDSENEEVR